MIFENNKDLQKLKGIIMDSMLMAFIDGLQTAICDDLKKIVKLLREILKKIDEVDNGNEPEHSDDKTRL